MGGHRPRRRADDRPVLDDDGGAARLKAYPPDLRFVAFDLPVLAGVDLRPLSWQERRDRLELLAQAFNVPLELSPVVEPTRALAIDITDGRLEGTVLKDGRSHYRDGTRVGWWKVKDPRWYERESWRFDHP